METYDRRPWKVNFQTRKNSVGGRVWLIIAVNCSTWIIMNAKQTWYARLSLASASLEKVTLFSETKKENHKDKHRKSISKIKEKWISQYDVNLIVLHGSTLSLLAARYSNVCTAEQKRVFFLVFFCINGTGELIFQWNQEKYKNILHNILSAHIIQLSRRNFAISTRTPKVCFYVHHLKYEPIVLLHCAFMWPGGRRRIALINIWGPHK